MCKPKITPRVADPQHWSDLQVSCEEHPWWKAKSSFYVQQVAEYQVHKASS